MTGMDTVYKFDKLPTKKEGIFVMPLERITIHSTFVVYVEDPDDIEGKSFVLSKSELPSYGGMKQVSSSSGKQDASGERSKFSFKPWNTDNGPLRHCMHS